MARADEFSTYDSIVPHKGPRKQEWCKKVLRGAGDDTTVTFGTLDKEDHNDIITVLELVERPRFNSTGVGDSPPFFSLLVFWEKMGYLSIFVDESGDIGEYQSHSPYYILTMVFHDQDMSLDYDLAILESELSYLDYKEMVIHTEPLIRREEAYCNLSPNERRNIFSKLYFFALKAPIRYKTIIIEKKTCSDVLQLETRLARELSFFIRDHLESFQRYDKVILYYDNGQRIINRLLNTVFASELSTYEMRRVMPKDYRLFQVADLICTIELIHKKLESGDMTKSERLMFHSRRDFYKDFVRRLALKRI